MMGLLELIRIMRLSDLRVSWVLQGVWIAGILPILIASIPSSRLTSFHHLVLGFARRGKLLPSSQKFTVPQKFFLHFYIFSVVWTTTLLAMTWQYAYRVAPLKKEAHDIIGSAHILSSCRFRLLSVMDRFSVWRSVFLLLLMEIQVVRRLYETLFVFKYSRYARMHIFAYLTGFYFYFAVPLSLCHEWIVEVLNFVFYQLTAFYGTGLEIMLDMEYDFWGYLTPFKNLGWCTWTGALLFYWGWIHQRNCHGIFGSLRRDKRDQNQHVIPRGDWFDYVSCPHYFAEMVIYAGIVIASGGTDLTIWLVLAFTVTNLCFASGEIHRWYLEKFEDYPRDRKQRQCFPLFTDDILVERWYRVLFWIACKEKPHQSFNLSQQIQQTVQTKWLTTFVYYSQRKALNNKVSFTVT